MAECSGSSRMVRVETLGSLAWRHSSCTLVRSALSALTGTLSGLGGLTYSRSDPSSCCGSAPTKMHNMLQQNVHKAYGLRSASDLGWMCAWTGPLYLLSASQCLSNAFIPAWDELNYQATFKRSCSVLCMNYQTLFLP